MCVDGIWLIWRAAHSTAADPHRPQERVGSNPPGRVNRSPLISPPPVVTMVAAAKGTASRARDKEAEDREKEERKRIKDEKAAKRAADKEEKDRRKREKEEKEQHDKEAEARQASLAEKTFGPSIACRRATGPPRPCRLIRRVRPEVRRLRGQAVRRVRWWLEDAPRPRLRRRLVEEKRLQSRSL